MTVMYSGIEVGFYLLLYSFAGWAFEMMYFTIRNKRFVNGGFLNLPFSLPYGFAAVLLIQALPTLQHNLLLQYVLSFVVLGTVFTLAEAFVKGISHHNAFEREHRLMFYNNRSIGFNLMLAGLYLILYLTVHPLVMVVTLLIPDILIKILVVSVLLLIALDFMSVLYTIRTSRPTETAAVLQRRTTRLLDWVTTGIWKRLQKEYPGIREPMDLNKPQYIFAEGLCFDKLVWVFLVSSFLGALIEMLYCHHLDGFWMNRSSLLYGTFSVVWGFGAVILTVALQRLKERSVFLIFTAGFLIGGSYEYLCSVMSELVFGTVFWDYSNMPLNIGGRTNVPYCMAWGLLAVIWVKGLYPPMSRAIEKIPTLLGECITWAIVVILFSDCLLTGAAMIRYTERQEHLEPSNAIAVFLDANYDDVWMKERWPNMKIKT